MTTHQTEWVATLVKRRLDMIRDWQEKGTVPAAYVADTRIRELEWVLDLLTTGTAPGGTQAWR